MGIDSEFIHRNESVYSFGSKYDPHQMIASDQEKETDGKRQIEKNHPVSSISKFRHNQTKLTLVHYVLCEQQKSLRVCQHRNVTQQKKITEKNTTQMEHFTKSALLGSPQFSA